MTVNKTTNLELSKPASGDNTVNWFDTMNTNMDLIDTNNPKVKLNATSAPTVNNDNTEGYAVGSRWIDVTNDKEYVALDVSTGAAVWKETTNVFYQEGTWTPVLKFGGNSVDMTYTTQAGLYTKIGRMVAVTCYIVLSAKGTSTGDATIEGLPFTSKNVNGATIPITMRLNRVTFANIPQGYILNNTAKMILDEITEAGVKTTLTEGDFMTDSSLIISATYFTD